MSQPHALSSHHRDQWSEGPRLSISLTIQSTWLEKWPVLHCGIYHLLMMVIVPGTAWTEQLQTLDTKSLHHSEWTQSTFSHSLTSDALWLYIFKHFSLSFRKHSFLASFQKWLVRIDVSVNDVSSLIGSVPSSLWWLAMRQACTSAMLRWAGY